MSSTAPASIPETLQSGAGCAPSAEIRWTLSVLTAAVHFHQHVPDADLKAPIHAERLLAFTERHGVTALLAWHLKNSRQLDGLAAPLAQALTASFHASMARAFTQLNELARTLGEFKDNGIDAIPWKGPVLAHRIFHDPAARECADLDILISPGSLAATGTILRRLGYLPMEYQTEVREAMSEDHCTAYLHATRPIAIELHTQPFPTSFPFPLAFDDLKLSGNSPRHIGSLSFPVMTAEWELLLSSAHAAKHLWNRLIWIVDIARLAEGMSAAEAASLDRLARQSRCHRTIQVSLLLAEDLLGAAIPEPIKGYFEPSVEARKLALAIRQRILDPDAPPENTHPKPGAWITTQLLRIRSRENFRDRVRIARCALHYAMASNLNDQEFIPGIRLNRGFAFLCRPIRLLANFASRVISYEK